MLVSMKLINFRCFREHEFTFGPLNVCVGVNNAGKSTLAEALRIVALASSRIKTSVFREPPEWLSIPRTNEGFSFSLQGQQINFETMFHRYGEPPATIRVDFGAFGRLLIYVASATKTHCIVYNGTGKMLKTREAAIKAGFPLMDALPQVGPVAVEETILNPSYVRGALSSRLAPIHFRNQLNLLYDLFPEFQRVVTDSWRGLSVVELIHHGGEQGKDLFLQIRDGDFVGEIGTMGHGLQMWLQTMWFLIRARHAATLILDEPDVYMHADLQRKLIRSVRESDAQIIVTTHSTEIMAEVAPEEILVIDKKLAESKRADSLPAVQAVLTRLGSAQNIHLFRLWSAKRFILVEGADLRLLQGFQNVLFPESAAPITAIPNASFGGWGGWSHALGSSIAMASAAGSQIATYAFLDSDYHNQSQVEQIYSEFARHHCQVHIWCRKEIENYLLKPGAVTKAIVSKLPKRAAPPSESEVRNKMNEFAASLTEEMFDAVAQEFISVNRALGVGGANKAAREAIDMRVQREGLLSCVSGKSVIQKLFSWVQNEFGASLNTLTVCRHLSVEDIDPEMKGVLSAIENAAPLPARSQASY